MAYWMRAMFGLGAGLLLAAGCGGSTTSGTGTVGPVPFDQLDDRIVAIYCGGLETCCGNAGYSFDPALCEAGLRGDLGLPAADRVYYDAVAAGQCLDSLRAGLASCTEPRGSSACDRVFRGRVPAGGACNSGEECAAGAGQDADCDAGVCVVTARGTAGSPCDTTCVEEDGGSSCSSFGGTTPGTCYRNDGFYCSYESETCRAVAAAGQPCTDYDACAVGLICLYGASGGVCSPRVPLGGACTNYDDCAEGFCDTEAGLCSAPRADGQPCQGSDECASGSCNFDTGVCEAGGGFVSPDMCGAGSGTP